MPFMLLFKSRKFWLLILDTVVSLITYFVSKYMGAQGADVLFVIGVLQPVFIAVIVSIGVEDAAAKRAGTFQGKF